jgi:hypothetical protein
MTKAIGYLNTENRISFYQKISILAKLLWEANGNAKDCPIAVNNTTNN